MTSTASETSLCSPWFVVRVAVEYRSPANNQPYPSVPDTKSPGRSIHKAAFVWMPMAGAFLRGVVCVRRATRKQRQQHACAGGPSHCAVRPNRLIALSWWWRERLVACVVVNSLCLCMGGAHCAYGGGACSPCRSTKTTLALNDSKTAVRGPGTSARAATPPWSAVAERPPPESPPSFFVVGLY